jgi:ABC-type multidrug transport system fused ATPase/permease subunit
MKTDHLLRKSISEDLPDTAVIMISQRATSLKNADNILVLDDGECLASGTHDELAASSPLYKEIIEIQKAGE